MALKLKDNSYVKLNLDECFINKKGVFISYLRYKDVEQRELEQKLLANFEVVRSNCLEYISKIRDEIYKDLSKEHNLEELTSLEELKSYLTEEQNQKLVITENLEKDLEYLHKIIQIHEDISMKNLLNEKLLKDFGLNVELYKNYFENPNIEIKSTSAYTGQKFTYDSMYKELKKLFKKDGYEDC